MTKIFLALITLISTFVLGALVIEWVESEILEYLALTFLGLAGGVILILPYLDF